MQEESDRLRKRLREQVKRRSRHFSIQPGTINGDAFWECGKTTLYLPKQKKHRPFYSNTGILLGITTLLFEYETKTKKPIVVYQCGKVYPVFRTHADAAYSRDFTAPHAHAVILSIADLGDSVGWEVNIERTTYDGKRLWRI